MTLTQLPAALAAAGIEDADLICITLSLGRVWSVQVRATAACMADAAWTPNTSTPGNEYASHPFVDGVSLIGSRFTLPPVPASLPVSPGEPGAAGLEGGQ